MNTKVPKSVQLQSEWNNVVQECVQLRKDNKITILELAKDFKVDRRKLMKFEKGEINLNIADQYLSYFGKTLIIYSL